MTLENRRVPALIGLLALTLAPTAFAQQGGAPGGGAGRGRGPQAPPLLLTVEGWADGTEVPLKYSCQASGTADLTGKTSVSPAMQWKQVPPATQSFLVLVHDPEPHPGRGVVDNTHWLIFNIPGTATGLPAGVPEGGTLPDGSHQVKRGNGPNGLANYIGPCAPPGPNHHYTYELWALDTKLDLGEDATRADVMKAAEGHVLGAALWIGMFHRPAPPQ